jgi:hypothetical protein
VNVTPIEHDPATGTLLLQSLVTENEPVAAMLVMESAAAPVFVNVTLCSGGGQGLILPFNLHEKFNSAGINCTVPSVSVMVALLNFVGSVLETALTLTLGFGGNAVGPLNSEVSGVEVVSGFIVPHAGEQLAPFCVSVQFSPCAGSLVTPAVNDGFPLMGMIPLAGCTGSITTAGTVINALATASGFAADVAVTVTSTSLAGDVGAV